MTASSPIHEAKTMSESYSPSPHSRVLVWDILRTVWFLAILFFHASWFFWPEAAGPPNPFPTVLWRISMGYIRMDFAGFAILMLSGFLLARSPRFPGPYFFPFLFGGWLLFQGLINLRDGTHLGLIWDIYPLLGVGLGSAVLMRRWAPRYLGILGIIGLLLPLSKPWLWPIWQTRGISANWLQVLVGLCPLDYADWPVLPWIGLIWSSFWLGHVSLHKDLRRWGAGEGIFWGALLIGLWPFAGSYTSPALGDGWACQIFRPMPATFYWHWAVTALLIRLGLLQREHPLLRPLEIFRGVSALHCNRHFFLAYMLQFPIFWALGLWLQGTGIPAYDQAFVLGVLTTEGLTRVVGSLLRRNPKSRGDETYCSKPLHGDRYTEETP